MPLLLLFPQDPGRIEVPVYIEGIVPLNVASLEDPVPCIVPKWCDGSTSPAGLAGNPTRLSLALGGSTATLSQPNSATSSLTSLLLEAEYQLSSRQSSGSDLGARPFLHSRLGSTDGSLSARSDRSHEDAVDAIATFDNVKCMALAKVKVQPPPLASSSSSNPNQGDVDGAVSPNRMVPVFQNLNGTTGSGESGVPGLVVRPTRVHTNTLPHNPTYNPYDLGALLADFKLKKSPSAGAAPPAPYFSGARVINRSISYNGPAVAKRSPFVVKSSPPVAVPQRSPPEHRPEGLVMIPGMRRVNTVG
jgi:hypothetical protein